MTHSNLQRGRLRRPSLPLMFAAPLLTFAAATMSGQQVVQSGAPAHSTSNDPVRHALTIDDYAKWNSVDASRISGDGKWAVYEVRQTNVAQPKAVLHLYDIDAGKDQIIANASAAIFSDDSRWMAYNVEAAGGRGGAGRGGRGGGGGAGAPAGPPGGAAVTTTPTTPPAAPGAPPTPTPAPGAQGGRGAGAGGAAPRRVELRNLATGEIKAWDDVQTFSFSPSSSHLMLRRRAVGGGGGAAGVTASRGADVILHDLTTRRDYPLGSVGELAFNKKGDLVAYTVDAAVRDGNGLFLLEPSAGRVTPIDNDARIYSHLTWNDDGTALAVLKGADVDRKRERDNTLLVYPTVRADMGTTPLVAKLDPATAQGFPAGWVVSDRATLTWAGDGKRLLIGIKEQTTVPDTSGKKGMDVVADVDVWRTADDRIQSVQMQTADADRNFTYRAAFEIATSKFITLSDSTLKNVAVTQDGRWAIGTDTRAYVSDYERPRADIYRVNVATGQRTLMFKGRLVGNQVFGTSPDSRYYVYWEDNQFQVYDLDSAKTRTLTKSVPVSFVDTKYDHPGPKPPFGIVGYTSDKKSVILEHDYDMWLVSLDGSTPARNLTNGVGTKNEIRFGYVRIASDSDAAPAGGRGGGGGGGNRGIDLSKPMLLSAYGEWTKKSGFYELRDGQMRELVYEDASFSTPTKAAKADRFLFTRQTFAEFPDLRVSGVELKNSKQISNANPQQADFFWGHRVLFDYKLKDGTRLQGTLGIPDDYKPGEKRPMIVNFYEKNSQNLHKYLAPSYLTSMGSLLMEAVSKGYIIMQPDVRFKTGSSHSDMLECVEAATRKVIELGYVDPKRIGINGHSYGGEGVAFIGTRSRLFAAIGMGAGVTDLTHDFDVNWGWTYQIPGSGANAFDYYVYGQGRWGTNPWDNPELFSFESARTHVREVTAPFLIMHGTADGTVSFQEGLAFYNALRFNKKDAILLAYPGEAHGLRGLANKRDLTIRYMQFFDHYLKDAAAPKWMTDGVPFLKKDGTKDPGNF